MISIKLAALTAALGIPLAVAGCATGTRADTNSASAGMMCPKCETVWVTKMVDQGTKIQRMASERSMTCPECDAMAKSQLTGDGKVMLHECPTCKVTPERVSAQPGPPSHPKGTH